MGQPMKIAKTGFYGLIFSSLVLFSNTLFAVNYAVVVNKSVNLDTMDRMEIRDIFLGKTKFTPTGSRWTVVDLPDNATNKNEFYLELTQKNPDQLRAYLIRNLFVGKSLPPIIVSSFADVKSEIAGNVNAIGYVPEDQLDDNVKTIFTIVVE